MGKRTRSQKGRTLVGGGDGGGGGEGDDPPRTVNACPNRGGTRGRRPRQRQALIQNLNNGIRNLGCNNAYVLLNHPALRPRVEVDIFFLHLVNGVIDFPAFSSNLKLLYSALQCNLSSTFMTSLKSMDCASGLKEKITSEDLLDVVEEVMTAKNLACLSSFLSFISQLKLALKVMAMKADALKLKM